MSSVPGRPAAWNRPTRSTWPRPPRRRCAASLNLVNAANQGGLEPFFDQPLARPRDRVDTALQRRRDLAVAPALTTVRGVGFQQDPGLQQLLCWMVSAMDKGGEMLSLLIAQCHYVFLYRDLFPGHQSAPSEATEPSSQTNAAESMTEATRPRKAALRGRGLRLIAS